MIRIDHVAIIWSIAIVVIAVGIAAAGPSFDTGISNISTTAQIPKTSEDIRPNIVFILTDNQAQAALGVYGNPEYASVVVELNKKLTDFFDEYADPKYDLWNGGTAKGSVQRPGMFQDLYGDDWTTVSEELPKFIEDLR